MDIFLLLQGWLGERGHTLKVRYAMRYGQPSIASQLDALVAEGVTRVLVMPAYPQYSCTSTASVIDAVSQWTAKQRAIPELRFVNSYHDEPGYIEAVVRRIERYWREHFPPDHLVMSFHGVPERVVKLGDPYRDQCLDSARRIAGRLGLEPGKFTVTFQSRFGRAKWLEPSTEATLHALGKRGTKRVDVVCPGFTSDCLETLEEIAMEGRTTFITAGGKDFHSIPCVNDDSPWITGLADIAEKHLGGWPTR